MEKKTNVEKIYECVDGLTKDINLREKKINKLESRIIYLEGKEYGDSLIRSGIDNTITCVLKILQKYPNNPKLTEEIKELDGRLKDNLKD